MSSKFDLCLLLYVISIVGGLKHCSISLSFTFHTWQNASRFIIYIAPVQLYDLMRSLIRRQMIADHYKQTTMIVDLAATCLAY